MGKKNVRVIGDQISSQGQVEREEELSFTKENFERIVRENVSLRFENKDLYNENNYYKDKCLDLLNQLDEKEEEIEGEVKFLRVAI